MADWSAETQQVVEMAGVSRPYGHGELEGIYDRFARSYWLSSWLNDRLLGVPRRRRDLMARATGDVLDVACGTGENFRYLRGAASITAIDLSGEMLDRARRRAHELGMEVTLRRMPAESLDFPDGTFDTVVSALSTCTFPEPITALREMKRVASDQGRILLLEHGRSSRPRLARFQDKRADRHYAPAGCRWNQDPIELVRAAGLPVLAHRRSFFGVLHAVEAAPAGNGRPS